MNELGQGTESGFFGATGSTPIGSDDKIQEFQEQLGSDVLESLLEKTPQTVLAEWDTLKRGVDLRDSEMILRAAHTIVGVAGSMGAGRLYLQAQRIEQQSMQFDAIAAALPEIGRTVDETVDWWNHHYRNL